MHPWLAGWIPTLVALHVLSAFAFAIIHGPSVAAVLALRTERELARVQLLLAMSRRWSEISWAAWSFLALTGSLLAFAQHTWSKPWVWGSVVVLILTTGSMSPLAARAFNEAREAAGLPWFDGRGQREPKPVDPMALRAALETIRVRSVPIALIGFAGLAALVALMVLRPG